MFSKLRRILNSAKSDVTKRHIDELKVLTGNLLSRQVQSADSIHQAEFKVFSQWGDDGIIQYLIRQIPSIEPVFIEFGVEKYEEANTRFLLINNNWKGLIIDGSTSHMQYVRETDLYWRYDLTAVDAFITRDNINTLFETNGFRGNIGILSIDLDGNDYWIWEKIDVVNPCIVIAEYNSVFGCQHAVSIPYDANFIRTTAHSSNLYWGASLPALVYLADRKGYRFIGCNSNGNNAYFIRKDVPIKDRTLTAEAGFVESRFRESRNDMGQLTYLSGSQRLNAIKDCSVVDVIAGKDKLIHQLFNG